jgi:hypothetical protein
VEHNIRLLVSEGGSVSIPKNKIKLAPEKSSAICPLCLRAKPPVVTGYFWPTLEHPSLCATGFRSFLNFVYIITGGSVKQNALGHIALFFLAEYNAFIESTIISKISGKEQSQTGLSSIEEGPNRPISASISLIKAGKNSLSTTSIKYFFF